VGKIPHKHVQCELLGWPIFEPRGFCHSLAEQVRDILRHEIHRGRWKIGERLPSISALAEQTGMSRGPIQRAFEMLREEKYVRQAGRNGTTLISLSAERRPLLGAIGIAAVVHQDYGEHAASGQDHLRFNNILEAARAHNYVTEVACLKADDDWQAIDRPGNFFSDRVLGIISLYPFSRGAPPKPLADRIPLVFLGDPYGLWREMDEESLPFVTGDLFEAIFQLTRLVISRGHRNIVLHASHGENLYGSPGKSRQYTDTCWRAYERAMQEAGLTANREAFEQSVSLPKDDFAACRTFLESRRDVTAIVCHNSHVAKDFVSAADAMGIGVPEDLSIVAQGYGLMRLHDPSRWLTRVQYDFARAVELSLDLLFEQVQKRECSLTRVFVKPVLIEGHSLAPPRSV